ncbi:hypothetical protein AMECASPLE_036169 [Ameca splendens]|uniref:Uncharacterized protein n=1 Tax=Ameca splendens TaxID=208324 RepID=A0ABV0YIZ6_9TELE
MHEGCGQEGSPVEVCLTADLKKDLTEETLLLYESLIKRMLRVLHFMKNPSLHNDLQRFQRSPQNRASLLYQIVEFFQVPDSDAATPADYSRRHHTPHNRRIEDMQHLAGCTKGPKLQELQSALSLLVDSTLLSILVNANHYLKFSNSSHG